MPPLLAEPQSVQAPEHWKYQGWASKKILQKYRTAKGHFYDCRSSIEALVTDEYHEVPCWTRTTVEHNGEDYYLVGYKGLSMGGLRVRVRSDT